MNSDNFTFQEMQDQISLMSICPHQPEHSAEMPGLGLDFCYDSPVHFEYSQSASCSHDISHPAAGSSQSYSVEGLPHTVPLWKAEPDFGPYSPIPEEVWPCIMSVWDSFDSGSPIHSEGNRNNSPTVDPNVAQQYECSNHPDLVFSDGDDCGYVHHGSDWLHESFDTDRQHFEDAAPKFGASVDLGLDESLSSFCHNIERPSHLFDETVAGKYYRNKDFTEKQNSTKRKYVFKNRLECDKDARQVKSHKNRHTSYFRIKNVTTVKCCAGNHLSQIDHLRSQCNQHRLWFHNMTRSQQNAYGVLVCQSATNKDSASTSELPTKFKVYRKITEYKVLEHTLCAPGARALLGVSKGRWSKWMKYAGSGECINNDSMANGAAGRNMMNRSREYVHSYLKHIQHFYSETIPNSSPTKYDLPSTFSKIEANRMFQAGLPTGVNVSVSYFFWVWQV
jgi:hypothetical protein